MNEQRQSNRECYLGDVEIYIDEIPHETYLMDISEGGILMSTKSLPTLNKEQQYKIIIDLEEMDSFMEVIAEPKFIDQGVCGLSFTEITVSNLEKLKKILRILTHSIDTTMRVIKD